MPLIDTSELLVDPDFVEPVTVLRRMQLVSEQGRVSTQNQSFMNVIACVQPQSDEPMVRGTDSQLLPALISVHTKFRLRGISPNFQPDIVIWNGNQFVVNKVFNWSHFGLGYVMAECSSMDHLDEPPGGPSALGGDGDGECDF